MNQLTLPTQEQCSNHAKVFETEHRVGYAIWYPQIVGYLGRAVAVMDKRWEEQKSGAATGGCINVYVWHDGDFLFLDNEGGPRRIRHCDPEQFIAFGKTLRDCNPEQFIVFGKTLRDLNARNRVVL